MIIVNIYLKEKKKIPKERFNINSFYDNDNDIGKIKNNQAGLIDDIYKFDNSFFKISNKESKTMDPQKRTRGYMGQSVQLSSAGNQAWI